VNIREVYFLCKNKCRQADKCKNLYSQYQHQRTSPKFT